MRRHLSAISLLLLVCLSACGKAGESEAEAAVRYLMKDPEATQFREVEVCREDPAVTRGDYNAKNSYGAYTGFEPFYWSRDEGVVLLEDDRFSQMMNRCYGQSAQDSGLDEASEPAAAADLPAVAAVAEDVSVEENAIAASDAEPPSCFGDYCPCETADPDYGGMDVTLCRNLEEGLPVSDELMAAGAASRDARRSLREFEDDNNDY